MAVDQAQALAALRAVEPFTDLTEERLTALADAARGFAFDDGDVIVSEGAEGQGFYVMLSGRARVQRGGADVSALGPGDFFGEIALLREGLRTATVIADGPARIIGLGRSIFRSLLADHPRVAMAILAAEQARTSDG